MEWKESRIGDSLNIPRNRSLVLEVNSFVKSIYACFVVVSPVSYKAIDRIYANPNRGICQS